MSHNPYTYEHYDKLPEQFKKAHPLAPGGGIPTPPPWTYETPRPDEIEQVPRRANKFKKQKSFRPTSSLSSQSAMKCKWQRGGPRFGRLGSSCKSSRMGYGRKSQQMNRHCGASGLKQRKSRGRPNYPSGSYSGNRSGRTSISGLPRGRRHMNTPFKPFPLKGPLLGPGSPFCRRDMSHMPEWWQQLHPELPGGGRPAPERAYAPIDPNP